MHVARSCRRNNARARRWCTFFFSADLFSFLFFFFLCENTPSVTNVCAGPFMKASRLKIELIMRLIGIFRAWKDDENTSHVWRGTYIHYCVGQTFLGLNNNLYVYDLNEICIRHSGSFFLLAHEYPEWLFRYDHFFVSSLIWLCQFSKCWRHCINARAMTIFKTSVWPYS